MEKLLTIGIATYNRQHSLIRLLHSLTTLPEDCQDLVSIIVCNDGGDRDIIDETVPLIFKNNPMNIEVIHLGKNQGVYISKTTCMLACNTPVYTHIDDDDQFDLFKLADLIRSIKGMKSQGGFPYEGILQCNVSRVSYGAKGQSWFRSRDLNGKDDPLPNLPLSLMGLVVIMNEEVKQNLTDFILSLPELNIPGKLWSDDVIIAAVLAQNLSDESIVWSNARFLIMDYYQREYHITNDPKVIKRMPLHLRKYVRKININ